MSDAFHISRLDWLLLIFLSTLWGMSFIFMELAIEELGTFSVAFFRVVIAALALNIIIAAQGKYIWQYVACWKAFAIMGVIGIAVPFSLIIWGQHYITASLASILNAAIPFFTLIMAHFFTHDEKMTFMRVVALLIGFIGVVIIIGPGALTQALDSGSTLGQLAVLLATMCYALMLVYGRRFAEFEMPGLVAATGQMTIASFVLLPFMLWEVPWMIGMPSTTTIGALLGVGLLSTALAFTVWYYLLARIGSNNLSLVTFMIPVSTIIIGYFVLNEVLTVEQIIGMVVVALGLVIVDGRLWKRFIAEKSCAQE